MFEVCLLLSFSSTHLLVFLVPVLLLALDGAVGSIPATPVDGLSLAVETLKKMQVMLSLC